MSKEDVNKFLEGMGMGKAPEPKVPESQKSPESPDPDAADVAMWDKIIIPKSCNVLFGDVGTGKTGLATWLLERYSEKWGLTPVIVGLPPDKRKLLPKNIKHRDSPEELTAMDGVIALIDEADLQLSMDDSSNREYITNFLMLYRQRKMILLLSFHAPRLVLARYLPFFSSFLHKRPPYLREYASKSKNDTLTKQMDKAEERFLELVPPGWVPDPMSDKMQPDGVLSHTWVIATRLRWEGMLFNPLASFWTQELSEMWAGTGSKPVVKGTGPDPTIWSGIQGIDLPTKANLMGWFKGDPEKKMTIPVTPEMEGKALAVGGIGADGSVVPELNQYQDSAYAVYEADEVQWIKKLY